MLVSTWLSNIAFHLQQIYSESCQTLFPSFCSQPSEVAVLFDSNLSSHHFVGQLVNLDLLLCTGFNSEHVDLFLCYIFTQRPMNNLKIELNNGLCSEKQQLFKIHRKFHFTLRNSDFSQP